jgi:hypothetical protein
MKIMVWLKERRRIKAEIKTIKDAILEIERHGANSEEDRAIRQRARKCLVAVGNRAVPALMKDLQEGCYQCEDALVCIGLPAEDVLVEALLFRCNSDKCRRVTSFVYHIMRALARMNSGKARPILEQMQQDESGPLTAMYATQALFYYTLPHNLSYTTDITDPKSDTAKAFTTMYRSLATQVEACLSNSNNDMARHVIAYAFGLAYFKLILRLGKCGSNSWTGADIAILNMESMLALAHVVLSNGAPISPELVGSAMGKLFNTRNLKSSFGLVSGDAFEKHFIDAFQSYIKDRSGTIQVDDATLRAVLGCCDSSLNLYDKSIRTAFSHEHCLEHCR